VSFETEVLRHRYIYLPWVEGRSSFAVAPELALLIARHRHRPLTVVTVRKNAVPRELAQYPSVTERSGYVTDGGVVLAHCPTYKVAQKLAHLEDSVIVLAEWATERFDGWARLNGAYNAVTRSTMTDGLTANGRAALDDIVFDGYKGWDDEISARLTQKRLADLDRLGEYDREIVLAFARRERGEEGIRRLYTLLDRFDAQRL